MKVLKYPCRLNVDTAVALGRFDGVHLAHRAVIESASECAKKGLVPCVFTFCDNPGKASVEFLATESEKRELIKSCGIEVMVNSEFEFVRDLTAEEFVREVLCTQLRAKEVFCGYNYRFGKGASADAVVLKELCEKVGVSVTCVPEVLVEQTSVSSTAIRALVTDGDVTGAKKLLGRPYDLCGEVICGNGIGRTIDIPTININVPKEKLLPRFGVYAAFVCMGDKVYKAVANIGVKPTVGSDEPTVEAYLLDVEGDFYGEYAQLCLVKFLRAEKKFSDLQELSAVISQDVKNAREILSLDVGV